MPNRSGMGENAHKALLILKTLFQAWSTASHPLTFSHVRAYIHPSVSLLIQEARNLIRIFRTSAASHFRVGGAVLLKLYFVVREIPKIHFISLYCFFLSCILVVFSSSCRLPTISDSSAANTEQSQTAATSNPGSGTMAHYAHCARYAHCAHCEHCAHFEQWHLRRHIIHYYFTIIHQQVQQVREDPVNTTRREGNWAQIHSSKSFNLKL